MPRATGDEPCRCGHLHVAHEHYRRGTDCALCACVQFRTAPAPARGLRLFRRVRGAAF